MEIDEPVPEASRAMTTSSSGRGTQGETPVANINYRIYRPFPSTNQVLMPFRGTGTFTLAANATDQTGVGAITFRLNSIYDIIKEYNYAANPDPSVADTTSGTLNQPQMRTFWESIYQYYTITRSRFMIRQLIKY